MVNDPDLAVRAAVDGLGIAYTVEALAEPFLRSRQLLRVLEDWSPSTIPATFHRSERAVEFIFVRHAYKIFVDQKGPNIYRMFLAL